MAHEDASFTAAKYADAITRLKEGGLATAKVASEFGLHPECFRQYLKAVSYTHLDVYKRQYYDPATAVPLYLGPTDNPGEFVSINCLLYTSRCV